MFRFPRRLPTASDDHGASIDEMRDQGEAQAGHGDAAGERNHQDGNGRPVSPITYQPYLIGTEARKGRVSTAGPSHQQNVGVIADHVGLMQAEQQANRKGANDVDRQGTQGPIRVSLAVDQDVKQVSQEAARRPAEHDHCDPSCWRQ